MNPFHRAARRLALPGLALLASACGHGSGSVSGASTLTIALTDAASDDIATFEVDLASIQLTKRGGGVVSVLAAPVHVDLVQLQELSQIVNVVSLPAGLYTAAEIAFDFTNAKCVLVGETTPATLVDELGNALTGLVTLPLSLAGAPINALGGRHRLLELDFDLDQSLAVDATLNQVSVAPSLVVRFDRSDPKELVAMGSLVSVDAPMNDAVVDLKTLSGAFLRQVDFAFQAGATFQIDGVPYVGTNGVNALAALPADTWIQAYGAANPTLGRIDVSYVEAGKGTWNGGSDVLEGHVVGRSGGAGSDATLTVLGHSQDATHTSFLFNTLFSVDVSFADTKVVRRADGTAFDADDLNVGQLVRIFGDLSGTTMDATATDAVVREQPTRLCGFSVGAPGGGLLVMDVARVDLRSASDFDWSDGGTTPPDPTQMQVDVGSLADDLGIVDGTPVVARGFFPAIDDSGEDFVADALVNRDLAGSLLVIRDRLLGFSVFTTTNASQIQFTITGAPGPLEIAAIDRGFVGVIPLPSAPLPTVVPAGALGLYVLRDSLTGAVQVDLDFASFASALGAQLASGRKLRDFAAIGPWDAATNTVEASIASAVIR
jgi:hypothetical protein